MTRRKKDTRRYERAGRIEGGANDQRNVVTDHKSAEKPVSLAPLEFKEAVRDLLRVRPDQAEAEESRKD